MLRQVIVCGCAWCFSFGIVSADLQPRDNDLPLLFIGVFSSPSGDNFQQRRMDVRQSWMQHPLVTAENSSVVVRFIVGEASEKDTNNATSSSNSNSSTILNASVVGTNRTNATSLLEEEERLYQDFVHLPVSDTYRNLPNKTMSFFHWFASESRAHFVMKVDDDTYPYLDMLAHSLRNIATNHQTTYMGKLLWNAPVLRTGKWAEDPALYSEDHYPVYASGSGYIISSQIVRAIVEAHSANQLKLLSNEDTSVGVAVNRTAHSNIVLSNVKASIVGCHDGDAFSMNLCPGEMQCMWAKHEKKQHDICCRPSPEYGNSYAQSFLQVRQSVSSEKHSRAAACKQTFEA